MPDSAKTLESDGLIWCQYDEHGKCVGTLVRDPLSIRVLCWQLTVVPRHDVSAVSLSLGTCWAICVKISPSELGLTTRARSYLNAARWVSGPSTFDGLLADERLTTPALSFWAAALTAHV